MKDNEKREKEIIEAALRVVAREGYYNLSMEKVAKEANMSKGGIAHYFSSKKKLFKAVFVKFFDMIFLRSKNTVKEIDDPIDKLVSFVWLYNWDDPDVFTGYPILFDFMSIASRDEDYREIFISWVNSWIDLLKDALKEAKEKGIIKKELDEDATARTISAIYQGIAERWYLDRENHSTNWAESELKKSVYGLLKAYLI
ncbi:hypothetical protein JCM13304A_20100 [Desulfothermus okinawensis JCM 13304]